MTKMEKFLFESQVELMAVGLFGAENQNVHASWLGIDRSARLAYRAEARKVLTGIFDGLME